jgi:hypothetical protein
MSDNTATARPRILLFSQRNLAGSEAAKSVLFRYPHYEFEDLICDMDSVSVVSPWPGKKYQRRHELAKQVAWRWPVILNPGVSKVDVSGTYDLFFAICGSPIDLLALKALPDWRRLAQRSICLIDELWVTELSIYRSYLPLLAKFDCVLLYYSQSVKAVSEAIGRPCRFLAPGVDALLFCPHRHAPRRAVDVYSVGRRSESTHQALLRLAARKELFYVYDSVLGNRSIDAKEHRLLLANTAKRSRYFLVNPALVDRQDVRGDQQEMGGRYFEGAAAGAIMIGECPKNEQFGKLFDWPNAVINLPYGSADIAEVMEHLESDPDLEASMRRNNVAQALLRHDWAYRWEEVLHAGGLEPQQGLLDRKSRLERLAKEVSMSQACPDADRVNVNLGQHRFCS